MSEFSLQELLWEKDWRRYFPDWETSTTQELADGFTAFCAEQWYITHPKHGKMLFELRDAQVETAFQWLDHRFSILLKARQLGFSTLGGAFAFWCAFGYSDRPIIILSKGQREARSTFNEKVKYGAKHLAEWLKVRGPTVVSTVEKMTFDNGSSIESLPSGTDPARGRTVWLVIFDEMAHLEHGDEAWASVEPIADVGGRVIALSTANGEGNIFYRLWDQAERGIGKFRGIFHPWWADPTRTQDWYDGQKETLPPWQLAQEYPDNPEEAFLRSGHPFFSIDKIREWEPVEPQRGFIEGDKFVLHETGALKVWALPVEWGRYCLAADVAEGLEHGDFSVVQVLDARNQTVVAEWHGHIDAVEFGEDTIYDLAMFYNQALVGVERNNMGLATVRALQRKNYPFLFRQRRLGAVQAEQATDQVGWHTTKQSKAMMCAELSESFGKGFWHPGRECIHELKTFTRDGKGKMGGSPHDDRVMALAIANQMLKHVWLPEYTPNTDPKNKVGTAAWMESRFRSAPTPQPRIGSFNVR